MQHLRHSRCRTHQVSAYGPRNMLEIDVRIDVPFASFHIVPESAQCDKLAKLQTSSVDKWQHRLQCVCVCVCVGRGSIEATAHTEAHTHIRIQEAERAGRSHTVIRAFAFVPSLAFTIDCMPFLEAHVGR